MLPITEAVLSSMEHVKENLCSCSPMPVQTFDFRQQEQKNGEQEDGDTLPTVRRV